MPHVNITPIQQLLVQYSIQPEILDKRLSPPIVGYALITGDVTQGDRPVKRAVLWHIYIEKEYRRARFATCLIAAIKWHYDSIVTQAATDNGALLLKACGFTRKENFYVWDKTPETSTSTQPSVGAADLTGPVTADAIRAASKGRGRKG